MSASDYYGRPEQGRCKQCGKPLALDLNGIPTCPACRARASRSEGDQTAHRGQSDHGQLGKHWRAQS